MTDFERTADSHWWQGLCFCESCGRSWQAVVEIPVDITSPQVTLECPWCHEMRGGPA